MHFMLTRAAGPPCVKGCVCADPHDGQGGRTGRPSDRSGRGVSSLVSWSVIGLDRTRPDATRPGAAPATLV